MCPQLSGRFLVVQQKHSSQAIDWEPDQMRHRDMAKQLEQLAETHQKLSSELRGWKRAREGDTEEQRNEPGVSAKALCVGMQATELEAHHRRRSRPGRCTTYV